MIANCTMVHEWVRRGDMVWPVTRIVRVLCRDSVVVVYRADNPLARDESVVVVTPLMSWN